MTDPTQPSSPTESDSGIKPSKEACTFGMLTHLLSLCGFLGIPFGNIIGPLVIWLIKKDMDPFVDDQGKESINFQITLMIVSIPLGILSLIPIVGCFTLLLLLGLVITALVYVIIATMKANEGIRYRYPLTIRLIK